MGGVIAVLQTDPATLEQLGRIADAQVFLSVIAALFAVLALAAGIMSYKTFKSLAHTLRSLEQVIDQLTPHARPLIDGVSQVARDAGEISQSVREKVDEVLETVDDVNLRVREASDAAEQRVRQFGAVLDVVTAEAEDVLLDAAATAHGVHRAARVLREPTRGPRRLPRSREGAEDAE